MTATLGMEIRHRVFIRAPREKVWEALTTPRGLDGWWGTSGAVIDPRPGGAMSLRWTRKGEHLAYRFDWPDDTATEIVVKAAVVEAKRPERFSFRWWDDDPSLATIVEFTLEERGGGTHLTVREHGFADSDQGRRSLLGNATGWGEASTLLKLFAEGRFSY